MIVPRTARDAIRGTRRAKVAARAPSFIARAGRDLVARLLERAGADCISTFSGSCCEPMAWAPWQ